MLPLPLVVTPHTGVWIETNSICQTKLLTGFTPHTGVWIETLPLPWLPCRLTVTPHTGVWIETFVVIVFLV